MNKYVQISAGRGPIECARVVAKVARELCRFCEARGFAVDLVDAEPHNDGEDCFMSLTFQLSGPVSLDIISEWEGSVQWIATANPFRPTHKRKNWFVGVKFFDEAELPVISDDDIRYETCRSGGKGGQNVNKVETSVRAIHVPTGLSVRCSDERSQAQNKELAHRRLILRLHDMHKATEADERTRRWQQHDALERGNPVKKFRGTL